MCYKIAPIKIEDAKDVYEIEKQLFGSAMLQDIINTLENKTTKYYALKRKEEIIGFFEISIIPPECEIYDIAIKTEYQGHGLSKLLMNEIISICKENACETIFLEVNSINYKAINLYSFYGFEKYSIRKNYYGENDAILMKLLIN